MSADSITSSTGPVTPQGELSFSSRHSVKDVPGITTVLEPFLVDSGGELDHTHKGVANHDVVASADVASDADVPMELDDVGVVQEVVTATSITVLIVCSLFMATSKRSVLLINFVLCSHSSRLPRCQTLLLNRWQNNTSAFLKIGI
jgi:hypothetical protein